MTTENNESLIGYDPLAWMNDESDEPEVAVENTAELGEINASSAAEEIEETIQPEPVEINMAKGSVNDPEVGITKPEITLDAILNIQGVSVLHEQVLKTLQDHPILEIDASAVKMVDTASLQLFVVLKQESIKLQKEVNFEFPSDKLIDAAKILGVYEMLGLDQASSGFF